MSDIVYSDGHREVRRSGETTAGGAYANYVVLTSSFQNIVASTIRPLSIVVFQNDVISNGIVGLTNECLLAMVADRLECFQASEFACEENENALVAVGEALAHLEMRTQSRKDRGVEGTHTV